MSNESEIEAAYKAGAHRIINLNLMSTNIKDKLVEVLWLEYRFNKASE